MTRLYRIMWVTTLVLAADAVISLERHLPAILRSTTESQQVLTPLQAQLDKQQKTLDALQAELTAFHKEVNERIAKEEKQKLAIKSVQAALAKIDEAEALRKAGDLFKAHTTLLSTKELLWKAGDFFTSEQARFRGLMTPIDAVLGAWKNGNGSVDVSKITVVLKPLLDSISHDN